MALENTFHLDECQVISQNLCTHRMYLRFWCFFFSYMYMHAHLRIFSFFSVGCWCYLCVQKNAVIQIHSYAIIMYIQRHIAEIYICLRWMNVYLHNVNLLHKTQKTKNSLANWQKYLFYGTNQGQGWTLKREKKSIYSKQRNWSENETKDKVRNLFDSCCMQKDTILGKWNKLPVPTGTMNERILLRMIKWNEEKFILIYVISLL